MSALCLCLECVFYVRCFFILYSHKVVEVCECVVAYSVDGRSVFPRLRDLFSETPSTIVL